MPNRVIKESIRTSKTINTMTDFQFRVWLYLITYVDDYGRGSADPELLKGIVFPRLKRLRECDIERTLAELADMGTIRLYTVGGESYLCFPNWGEHQRIQTKISKFPEPTSENGNPRWLTVDHGGSPLESNPESRIQNPESGIRNPESKRTPARDGDAASQLLDRGFSSELLACVEAWLLYKAEKRQAYKSTGLRALLTAIERHAAKSGNAAVIECIETSMSNGWQGIVWDRIKPHGLPGQGSETTNPFLRMALEMREASACEDP